MGRLIRRAAASAEMAAQKLGARAKEKNAQSAKMLHEMITRTDIPPNEILPRYHKYHNVFLGAQMLDSLARKMRFIADKLNRKTPPKK